MARLLRPFLLPGVFFLFASAASAQQEFEGRVTSTMDMNGMMTTEVVAYTKSGKVRQEMSMMGQDVVSIMDMKAGISLTLMPQQKAYMKLDFNELAKNAETDSVKPPTLAATGKNETILGHACEMYTMAMPQGSIEMCVAKDLGFYMGAVNQGPGGPSANANVQEFADMVRKTFKDGFFPLKTVLSFGGFGMTTTVTKIERQAVPDEKFKLDIPSDFTEMKLPGRGGGPGGTR
jgi:hypothetical protein